MTSSYSKNNEQKNLAPNTARSCSNASGARSEYFQEMHLSEEDISLVGEGGTGEDVHKQS